MQHISGDSEGVSQERDAPQTPHVPYINVSRLSKNYTANAVSVTVLKDIDLKIAPGEFISILGPSGCGKSTLLKCIAGLERPSAGGVFERGELIDEPPADMGIVFQRDLLLDWKTILDNVLLVAEFKGIAKAKVLDKAKKLLKTFGLQEAIDRYPWQLSGGMRQRAAICRALLTEPQLLLMDEPFGALDALTRDQLNLELERLWYRTRKTVVFITHGIVEAVYLSDRVVVMDRKPGRIAEIIDIDIPRPRDLDVRGTQKFNDYVVYIRKLFSERGMLQEH